MRASVHVAGKVALERQGAVETKVGVTQRSALERRRVTLVIAVTSPKPEWPDRLQVALSDDGQAAPIRGSYHGFQSTRAVLHVAPMPPEADAERDGGDERQAVALPAA